jgi:hypothetical protein
MYKPHRLIYAVLGLRAPFELYNVVSSCYNSFAVNKNYRLAIALTCINLIKLDKGKRYIINPKPLNYLSFCTLCNDGANILPNR